jgi:hypothetical protein
LDDKKEKLPKPCETSASTNSKTPAGNWRIKINLWRKSYCEECLIWIRGSGAEERDWYQCHLDAKELLDQHITTGIAEFRGKARFYVILGLVSSQSVGSAACARQTKITKRR